MGKSIAQLKREKKKLEQSMERARTAIDEKDCEINKEIRKRLVGTLYWSGGDVVQITSENGCDRASEGDGLYLTLGINSCHLSKPTIGRLLSGRIRKATAADWNKSIDRIIEKLKSRKIKDGTQGTWITGEKK